MRAFVMGTSGGRWLHRIVAISALVAGGALFQEAQAETKVTLSFRASAGPAVAVFNNQLYLAFIGTDSNETLDIASSADGLHFGAAASLGTNHSFDQPGLAAFNGQLYMAWTTSVGTGSRLAVASSTDGVHFGTPIIIPTFTSAHGVALTAVGGTLYLAFDDTTPSHFATILQSTDGVNFTPHAAIGRSDKTPSLATLGTQLISGYTELALPEAPFPRIIAGGQIIPSGVVGTARSSSAGPGIGILGTQVWVAWTGSGLAQAVHYTVYEQPAGGGPLTFVSNIQTPEGAVSNPTIIGFGGHPYLFWTGNNAGQNLNVEQLQ